MNALNPFPGLTRGMATSEKVNPAGANTVDRDDFVGAMGRAATGVSIITTDGRLGRWGLTVSAVTSVSADPPMLLACVNRRSPLSEAVTANSVFAVNLLESAQTHLADAFAGRPREGEEGYDFNLAQWSKAVTGAPCLEAAVASFDCVLQSFHDAGSHRIFIGRVLSTKSNEGEPLIYSARQYGRHSPIDD